MVLGLINISKQFNGQSVLREVSFSIRRGAVFALCGASGSGKTTLVRIISGLCSFDAGELRIAEQTIRAGEPRLERHHGKIGVVFQEHNLFPHMTALENVCLALRQVRRMPKREAEHRACEELEKVGLSDKAKQHPASLSGGERQRVAIARALAMDPLLLLLDEPTSALDPLRVEEVLRTIHRLAKLGTTMLLVTHNLEFAKHTAQQFGVLEKGGCKVSSSADILDVLKSGSLFA